MIFWRFQDALDAPFFPMTWRQAFWTLVEILYVLFDSVTTPPRHVHTSFYVRMWSYLWVHFNDFYADGVDMLCDGNHRHTPFMHTGRKAGKAFVLGRHGLVPSPPSRRSCPVRHEGVCRVVFLSVGWSICIVMLILQRILQPPESTVDRVLCQ